jgi:hypothetical protein
VSVVGSGSCGPRPGVWFPAVRDPSLARSLIPGCPQVAYTGVRCSDQLSSASFRQNRPWRSRSAWQPSSRPSMATSQAGPFRFHQSLDSATRCAEHTGLPFSRERMCRTVLYRWGYLPSRTLGEPIFISLERAQSRMICATGSSHLHSAQNHGSCQESEMEGSITCHFGA